MRKSDGQKLIDPSTLIAGKSSNHHSTLPGRSQQISGTNPKRRKVEKMVKEFENNKQQLDSKPHLPIVMRNMAMKPRAKVPN